MENSKELKLMGKSIDLEKSLLLYERAVSAAMLSEDWKMYGGEWWVNGEWIEGKNPESKPAMIIAKDDFVGNVMVDFYAATVLPSSHDIDVMWNGSWDEDKNQRHIAYVAGIEGWWVGKVGIEKSPDYKFFAGTPLFEFEPSRVYHIQAGSIDGHCFVFIDGKLIIEATDLDPIDSTKFAKIGFEAYSSHIRLKQIKIYRLDWQSLTLSYPKEF